MANILTTIRTGFYTYLLSGSSSFKTAITQTIDSTDYYNIYNHQAPSKVTGTITSLVLPYVVFDILPISTSRDSASKMFDGICQFRIVASTIGAAETLAGYLIDLLEDSESSLSFTNYNLIKIEKEPVVPLGQSEGRWNIVVPYLITIGQ